LPEGIDKDRLIECDTSDRQMDRISEDVKLGIDLGINSTPTIFINSYQVAEPTDEIMGAIVVKLLKEEGIGVMQLP